MRLSTSLLSASALCSAAKWLLCRWWIHYILEIFHPPPPPGNTQHCSGAWLLLLPSIPQTPACPRETLSLSLSICPRPSLKHFPPLFLTLLSSLCHLTLFIVPTICNMYIQSSPYPSLSPPSFCGISRMSTQRSRWPDERQRNALRMLANTQEERTQTNATKIRHWPHDHGNHRHDDFIEDVEEVTHDLPPLAHPAHADPESDEEANQALRKTQSSTSAQSPTCSSQCKKKLKSSMIKSASSTHLGRSCPIYIPVSFCSPKLAQFGSVLQLESSSALSEPVGRRERHSDWSGARTKNWTDVIPIQRKNHDFVTRVVCEQTKAINSKCVFHIKTTKRKKRKTWRLKGLKRGRTIPRCKSK